MAKLFYRLIEIQFFVLWLLAVVIPKSQFKVIFVSEIAVFLLLTVYNILKIKDYMYVTKKGQILWWLFAFFFVLAGVMLYLSYKDLASYWNILFLYFEQDYIYRHFMVVAELFLSIGLGYAMMKTGTVFKVRNRILVILTVLIGLVIFYNQGYIIFLGGLFVAAVSLLAVRTRHRWLYLLIPLVMISHSAYVLASVVMLALIFLKRPFKSFFATNPTGKILVLILFFVAAVVVFNEELYVKIRSDANSYWRLQVWTNELESLAKTYYTGVGFGTAYVTGDINLVVNNANMYIDDEGKIYERLFVVANHNSVLNMFYRLGLLGGLLFVSWNILICSICLTSYRKKILGRYNEYCWWAFTNYMYNLVIIALNPGMEMMQFAINYTFSLGLMFAVVYMSNWVLQQQNKQRRLEQIVKARALKGY